VKGCGYIAGAPEFAGVLSVIYSSLKLQSRFLYLQYFYYPFYSANSTILNMTIFLLTILTYVLFAVDIIIYSYKAIK